ncbi:MAG: hypothetical protein AAF039_18140 [Bacteroidota bacterium]
MTTDKIVGNYLTAIGGYENLQKVNSLVKNGNYIEPAYNLVLDAQQLRMRPNYRKVGNLERVDFEEGFDGTAWEYHRDKGLIISEGEAKEAIVVASDFDFPFIDAEKKGYQIKLIGTKEIGGLQAYDISVTMPFENTEYVTNFYFDTNSHLMIAQRKVMPIHAKGEDVDFIVLYSDYKAVNGVLYPFTQIERNEKTGQFLNATIWSEMIPNTNLTLQNFNPPSP